VRIESPVEVLLCQIVFVLMVAHVVVKTGLLRLRVGAAKAVCLVVVVVLEVVLTVHVHKMLKLGLLLQKKGLLRLLYYSYVSLFTSLCIIVVAKFQKILDFSCIVLFLSECSRIHQSNDLNVL
jgi:hypothetical protein